MYHRELANTIQRVNRNFPVLLVTGPRQVGKTTLLEMCASKKRDYVTLDDFQARELAQKDPSLFLKTYKPPIIIDEIQYAPQLFTYIKIEVDRKKKNGLFWLTGSQNFRLMKGITESLAGRIAILNLLGLSQREINGKESLLSQPFLPHLNWLKYARKNVKSTSLMQIYKQIWLGSFPRIHNMKKKDRDTFYSSYISTFIQRDVKDIFSISSAILFVKFLSAVAARTGQLLNYADLSRDVGIDNKTAKSWLSVLETSGLIYLLMPYYNNFTKRLIKTPKLYFLDTGLCSYLTKWPTYKSLESGAMSGYILETYLFNEILKSYWHKGKEAHFYYFRNSDQKEIDLLIETGDQLYPVEFKKTANPSRHTVKHFQVLNKLKKKIGHSTLMCFVEKNIPLSQTVTAIPISYL